MQLHLEDVSTRIPNKRHAAVVMNKAAWHTTKKLKVPDIITIISLPAASPELNLQEQIWQWLRKNHFANRVFNGYEDILDSTTRAWNDLTSRAGLIKSIVSREWAYM